MLGSAASTAPLTAPIDVPKIRSGMMPASSKCPKHADLVGTEHAAASENEGDGAPSVLHGSTLLLAGRLGRTAGPAALYLPRRTCLVNHHVGAVGLVRNSITWTPRVPGRRPITLGPSALRIRTA